MKKYQIFLLFTVLFLLFTIITNAQTTCPTDTRATGLISSSQPVEGLGNPGGNCAVDESKIAFAPFKIPTYEDLKSLYFTQSKASKRDLGDETNQGNLNAALSEGLEVVRVNNLTINAPFSIVNRPLIVFVDGAMNIYSPITNGGGNAGAVFVVKGNINIMYDTSINAGVTRVDAVLISESTICTASLKDFTCPKRQTEQLLINGSLISLDQSKPLQLVRTLSDNSLPAEKIVWQPKYLVILRNLLSDTYQKWSEIQ